MSRPFLSPARATFFASLLLSMAACTQDPALVEMKGHQVFSRDGLSYSSGSTSYRSGSYNSASSAPTFTSAPVATVSTSSVGSIGVTDLSTPKANTASSSPVAGGFKTASAPVSAVKPETLKPAAGGAPNKNPWTGKVREVELKSTEETSSFNIRPQTKSTGTPKEQMVSEVKAKPASEGTVAKLDSIISNEGAEKSFEAAKPVASSGYIWPVSSKKVISSYGPKGKGRANDGINIASSQGEPIWAVADGEVVYVGNELKGYGNMVLIKHAGNQSTTYAHLSRANVDKYDRVKQGDIIGYVGNTGNVKEPQLHFAVRDGKDPVDPIKFMKQRVASLQ